MATESEFTPEIFEDLGQVGHIEGFYPHRDEGIEVFEQMKVAESITVRSIIVDAGRFVVDALAGIREHPRGAVELGAASAATGALLGTVIFRSFQSPTPN